MGDGSGSATTGVTYNGVTLTSVAKVHSNNTAGAGYVELFRLIAPATGANTVVATTSASVGSISAGSVSFNGVDQTSPLGTAQTAFGNSDTVSVAVPSTATGNMVIDAACAGAGFTADTQTLRWRRNTDTLTGAGNGTQSTAAGTGSSVTMSHSIPTEWWAAIAAEVRVVGSSGSTITLTGTTYFSEDFAAGNLLAFGGIHNVRNNFGDQSPADYVANTYHVQVVSVGGSHGNVVRFEVRDGDTFDGGSTERTELMLPTATHTVEGDERWFQFDIRLGDPTWANTQSWELNWQWHHDGLTGSPPLTVESGIPGGSNTVMSMRQPGLSGNPTETLWTIRPGEWERVTMHVKFSNNPAVGFVRVWVNDVEVLPMSIRRTMIDNLNYPKCGIYRDGTSNNTQVVMLDNIKIASSAIVP